MKVTIIDFGLHTNKSYPAFAIQSLSSTLSTVSLKAAKWNLQSPTLSKKRPSTSTATSIYILQLVPPLPLLAIASLRNREQERRTNGQNERRGSKELNQKLENQKVSRVLPYLQLLCTPLPTYPIYNQECSVPGAFRPRRMDMSTEDRSYRTINDTSG